MKKGDLFMIGIDVLFLISIILIFWKLNAAFAQPQQAEGIGTRQTALLHTYAVSEQMLLYLDETAKFAAYESIASTMKNAGINPVDTQCQPYASYSSWSDSKQDCFPNTKQQDTHSTYAAFEKELQHNIQAMNKLFPTPLYTFQREVDNGLHIDAIASDKIALPIIAAKDARQLTITKLLLQSNIAKIVQGNFDPDSPLATASPSPNRKIRLGDIDSIIIHSTQTATISGAQKEYIEGSESVHYLIDENGGIMQLVPEDQRAFHIDCDKNKCTQPDIEDRSIGIALVNQGATNENPTKSGNSYECTDDVTKYDALRKTPWCGTEYYKDSQFTCTDKSYNLRCWAKYTPAQLDALKNLVIDVAKRNEIDVSDIYLEDQITQSDSPGPALRVGDQTQQQWWKQFIIDVQKGISAPDQGVQITPTPAADTADNQPVVPVTTDNSVNIAQCSVNTMPSDAKGDKNLDETLKNLNKIPGVLDAIKQAAQEQKLDYKLIVAIMVQESHGDPTVVSWTGCAGLGQFCMADAKGDPKNGGYSDIFGPGVTKCTCPGHGTNDCHAAEANCANDPRMDPLKNARATARHIKNKMNYKLFQGKTDQFLFGIAAYNGGEGTIGLAIQKTGKANPSWSEVSAAIDEQLIFKAFCKRGCPSFVNTPQQRDAKAKEIRDYVGKVMKYYTAQGGTTASVFTDQTCDNIDIKELGTYSFYPSFSVDVPNLLTAFDPSVKWAQQTYKECDGKDGADNRDCFKSHVVDFSKNSGDLEIVDCGSLNESEAVITSFGQAFDDCRANKQNGCACTWTPQTSHDVRIKVYDDTYQTLIDDKPVQLLPPAEQRAQFALYPGTAIRDVQLDLVKNASGSFMHVVELNTGASIYPQDRPAQFVMLKQDGDITWTTSQGNVPACYTYKTTQQVCVRLKHPIPVLSKGTFENPVIKFALYLNDMYPPSKVTFLPLSTQTEIPVLSFTAPSQDVSYYKIWCSLSAEKYPDTATTMDGRSNDIPIPTPHIDLSQECKPYAPNQKYKVKVVAVDISGNEGDAAEFDMAKQDVQNAVTGQTP